MKDYFKKVFYRETVFLDCQDLRDLVRCQWRFVGPRLWVTYRLLAALYLVGVLIWAFVVKFMKYQWKFFTYLSHWGYTTLVVSHVIKLICSLKWFHWLNGSDKVDPSEERPLLKHASPSWFLNRPYNTAPSLLQFSWLLSNITLVFAIYITYGFYNGGSPANPVSEALNFQIHALNTLFAAFDFVVAKQPTFLLHFYQPLCFGLIYLAFTAFYYLAGGTDKNGMHYIYEWYDWKYPNEDLVISCLSLVVQIVGIYAVLWVVSVLRGGLGACLDRGFVPSMPQKTTRRVSEA